MFMRKVRLLKITAFMASSIMHYFIDYIRLQFSFYIYGLTLYYHL